MGDPDFFDPDFFRGMTKPTRETAKRDISDLVTKGILEKRPGGGRSSSYNLVKPMGEEFI
jgi:DeoR/GlpR family transcriptional regulator of sugar metabolism